MLANVDLAMDEGEFLAIVGYSGSGKTTLISLLAGLIAPDAGTVAVAGETVRGAGPDRAIMFQNYSLLPWLTVHENVALAARAVQSGATAGELREYVEEYVQMVGLGPARGKRPAELSGGMRQRVALARALAMNPRVLLLDEPLSALDALTRARMQDELVAIWGADRKTVVMITNDVDEAILLADRIVPLDVGPGAGLGPSFRVALDRPRDRTAVNHDPEFKRLRNAISGHLIALGQGRAAGDAGSAADGLPDLQPAPLGPWASRAFG